MLMLPQDSFHITPRVFRARRRIELDVRGIALHRRTEVLQTMGTLSLLWIRVDGTYLNGDIPRWGRYEGPTEPKVLEDGTLHFTLPAQDEGEIFCRLLVTAPDGAHTEICTFSIYVLKADLYGLLPLKGDMHVHSSFSACGGRTEDPLDVAAHAICHGLDFIALTDHVQREGSEYLMEQLGEWYDGDFQVYPGEECHLIEHHLEKRVCGPNDFLPSVHIVSFGARDGVIRYANDHFAEYRAEIGRGMDKLDPRLPELMRFAMAGSDWIFDKIHEFEGLAIFAHPFWRAVNRLNLPAPVREYIMRQRKFDAMELPGLASVGSREYLEGNELAAAFWTEESVKAGKLIPLVGDTDSHDANTLLGRQYTIVWAPRNRLEDIHEAIRSGRTVTVSFYEKDTAPRLYGSLRLVSLARFLIKELFPLAKAERAQEGLALLQRLRER